MKSIKNKIKKGTIISLSSLALTIGCSQKPPEMAEVIKKPMMELVQENYPIQITRRNTGIGTIQESMQIKNGYLECLIAQLVPGKTIKDIESELSGTSSIPIKTNDKYGHTVLLIQDEHLTPRSQKSVGPILYALNQGYGINKEFNIDLYNLKEPEGAIICAFDTLKNNSLEGYAHISMRDESTELENELNRKIEELEQKSPLSNCGIGIGRSYKGTVYTHEKGQSLAKLLSCNIFDLKTGKTVSNDKYMVLFLEQESKEWKVREFF
tara:strand:+ start:231 stop:1031 length:801 start_codon:yes stop_codon:yes gene_type:complete